MSEYVAEAAMAERRERIRAGVAMCRAAIAEVLAGRVAERPAVELSRSDELLQQARVRATQERRMRGVS